MADDYQYSSDDEPRRRSAGRRSASLMSLPNTPGPNVQSKRVKVNHTQSSPIMPQNPTLSSPASPLSRRSVSMSSSSPAAAHSTAPLHSREAMGLTESNERKDTKVSELSPSNIPYPTLPPLESAAGNGSLSEMRFGNASHANSTNIDTESLDTPPTYSTAYSQHEEPENPPFSLRVPKSRRRTSSTGSGNNRGQQQPCVIDNTTVPTALTSKQINDGLIEKIKKPRFDDACDPGITYVLDVHLNSDGGEGESMCKIGETTLTIDQRIKTIMAQCKYTKVSPKSSGTSKNHFFKVVEKLAHAELAFFKYDNGPCSCKTTHRELFKVEKQQAIEVVERWHRFCEKKPWDASGNLKAFWRARLDEMPSCEDEGPSDYATRAKYWDSFISAENWSISLFYLCRMSGDTWKKRWEVGMVCTSAMFCFSHGISGNRGWFILASCWLFLALVCFLASFANRNWCEFANCAMNQLGAWWPRSIGGTRRGKFKAGGSGCGKQHSSTTLPSTDNSLGDMLADACEMTEVPAPPSYRSNPLNRVLHGEQQMRQEGVEHEVEAKPGKLGALIGNLRQTLSLFSFGSIVA